MRELDSKPWLEAFHIAEDYKRLLGKVLGGLVAIGWPHAEERQAIYLEELGTTGPAAFFTPWELTLEALDWLTKEG